MNQREWKEWSRRSDSEVMRQDFRLEATDRIIRLFAVACCRRLHHLLADERSQRAVDIAEQFADGLTSESELEEARRAAEVAEQVAWVCLGENEDEFHSPTGVTYHAAHAARKTAEKDCRLWLDDIARSMFDVVACNPDGCEEAENQAQRHLLRDFYGNPFRPLPPKRGRKKWEQMWRSSLAWNDGTVVKIAQDIYDERAFDRLPILADALEESGCTNPDIPNHCRSEGPHVRGCWVVDLILGKG